MRDVPTPAEMGAYRLLVHEEIEALHPDSMREYWEVEWVIDPWGEGPKVSGFVDGERIYSKIHSAPALDRVTARTQAVAVTRYVQYMRGEVAAS